jgi:hypothetical protein
MATKKITPRSYYFLCTLAHPNTDYIGIDALVGYDIGEQ